MDDFRNYNHHFGHTKNTIKSYWNALSLRIEGSCISVTLCQFIWWPVSTFWTSIQFCGTLLYSRTYFSLCALTIGKLLKARNGLHFMKDVLSYDATASNMWFASNTISTFTRSAYRSLPSPLPFPPPHFFLLCSFQYFLFSMYFLLSFHFLSLRLLFVSFHVSVSNDGLKLLYTLTLMFIGPCIILIVE